MLGFQSEYPVPRVHALGKHHLQIFLTGKPSLSFPSLRAKYGPVGASFPSAVPVPVCCGFSCPPPT
eukprot:3874478-Rhodomonas_salina.1